MVFTSSSVKRDLIRHFTLMATAFRMTLKHPEVLKNILLDTHFTFKEQNHRVLKRCGDVQAIIRLFLPATIS